MEIQNLDYRIVQGWRHAIGRMETATRESSPRSFILWMTGRTLNTILTNAAGDMTRSRTDGSWFYRGVRIVEDEDMPHGELRLVYEIEVIL